MISRHRRARVLPTALVATLALGLLVGCATSPSASTTPEPPLASELVPLAELEVLSTPRDYEGPSTAMLAKQDATPTVSAPDQALPATVTSHDLDGDVEVTVGSTDRIIGLDLSGSIAATIFALGLGDNVVGRDVSTTFDEAAELPLVTVGGHSISSEAILALEPDVIVTDGTIGPIDVLLQLRDAGIAIVFVKPEAGIGGAGDLARQVATALGADAAGEELASRLKADIDAKVAEISGIVPAASEDRLRIVFLYLRGSGGIYYLFGAESGADSLIESLGGIDVASEQGWTGMKPMTDEALVAADPDLVLVMTDGLASVGGVNGLLDEKPAIALTKAGQHKRFVDMADGEVLSFGPRTPAVLDALARALYAPDSD